MNIGGKTVSNVIDEDNTTRASIKLVPKDEAMDIKYAGTGRDSVFDPPDDGGTGQTVRPPMRTDRGKDFDPSDEQLSQAEKDREAFFDPKYPPPVPMPSYEELLDRASSLPDEPSNSGEGETREQRKARLEANLRKNRSQQRTENTTTYVDTGSGATNPSFKNEPGVVEYQFNQEMNTPEFMNEKIARINENLRSAYPGGLGQRSGIEDRPPEITQRVKINEQLKKMSDTAKKSNSKNPPK